MRMILICSAIFNNYNIEYKHDFLTIYSKTQRFEKGKFMDNNKISGYFEKLAVKYLPEKLVLYMLATMTAGFFADLLFGAGRASSFLRFSRDLIFKGQIWRVVTYPFVSDYMGSLNSMFSFILNLFMIYVAAQLLSQRAGIRKTNGFLLLSWVLITITGFIFGGASFGPAIWGLVILAALYSPDFQINLYFIIPIRGTLIAILGVLYLIYSVIMGSASAAAVLLALLGFTYHLIKGGYRVKKRSGEFRNKVKTAVPQYRHKCAECGITDIDDPDMTFRFCSQCEGNFEYCEKHIKNHAHRSNVIDITDKLKANSENKE